MTGNG
jgi:hypothetical protein